MKLWNKLIKTKRDRNIAIIFAVLIVYVLSDFIWSVFIETITGVGLSRFMMKLFPDKMTCANYPGSYENLFVTAAVLTIAFTVGKKGMEENGGGSRHRGVDDSRGAGCISCSL